MPNEIYRFTLPSGTTYDIKDKAARDLIAGMKSVIPRRSTNAATTPENVQWYDDETLITGTLEASEDLMQYIYYVPAYNQTNDVFDEYVVLREEVGQGEPDIYMWERLGSTKIDLEDLGDLAYKDNATGTYQPEGTISQPSFTGNSLTSTGTSTPRGTVSKPTATVTPTSSSVYAAASATGGGSVTPGQAASATMPVLDMSVSNETLVITWTDGSFTANTPTSVTLPTFSSQSVLTAVSVDVSQPTFSGTQESISVSGTPTGTVSTPTFSGTSKSVTVS